MVSSETKKLLAGFPGPLLMHERSAGWTVPSAERVERTLISLAIKAGRLREAGSERHAARALYSKALEFYPNSDELMRALDES